jgi:hypothetical protein
MISKNAFSLTGLGKYAKIDKALRALPPSQFLYLRRWQKECFEKICHLRYWRVNCPTAAGKTLLILAQATYRLQQDARLRVVFSVPQTIIAAGFKSACFTLPSGEEITWSLVEDYCADRPSGSVIKKFLRFLRSKGTNMPIPARSAVCTHSTLVAAYKRDPQAFRDLLVVVDEGHHAQCVEPTKEDQADGNSLGSLVHDAIETKRFEVGLSTATFFRSDMTTIIPKHHLEEFAAYNMPYHRFFEEIKPFDNFKYDYVLYQDSWLAAATELLAARKKTLVYIPRIACTYKGGKRQAWNTVYAAIAGMPNPVVKGRDAALTLVQRKDGSWARVVNLVDPRFRGAKKEIIRKAHDNHDRDAVDVIVALGMFREGANWEFAEREIIIGPCNSLTYMVQTMGRLFRVCCPQKQIADVYHLLQYNPDEENLPEGMSAEEREAEAKEDLNNYLKAIFMSMLVEDIVNPPRVPRFLRPRERKENIIGGEAEPIRLLDFFGDPGVAGQFQADVRERYLEWTNTRGDTTAPERRAAFDQIVAETLKDYDHDGHTEDISECLWLLNQRRNMTLAGKLQGIDVDDIDVNLIHNNEDHPFQWALDYTTGLFHNTSFLELQKRLSRVKVPYEEMEKFIRTLNFEGSKDYVAWVHAGCPKREGVLPCPQ